MKDFSDVTIGSVGDITITLKDLLFEIKTDLDHNVFEKVVHNVILGNIAQELGVSVSDQELQTAVDKFRMEKGLISAEETNEWLRENAFTIEDFEQKLEYDLLKEKVRAQVATPEACNKYFAENMLLFEQAKIAQVVVNDQGLAEEIKLQLDEGEAEFADLASKYSTDPGTRDKGGYAGMVVRNDLPDEVEVLVFADDAAGLIGPVKAGGGYYIVKVLEPKKAAPESEETKEVVGTLLFDEYMMEKALGMETKLNFIP